MMVQSAGRPIIGQLYSPDLREFILGFVGGGDPLAERQVGRRRYSTWCYFVADHLGSISVVADLNGNVV
jgi:hypothetical protein